MEKIVDLDAILSLIRKHGLHVLEVDNFLANCPDYIEQKPKSHKKGEGIHGEYFTDFRNAYVDFYYKRCGFLPTMGANEKRQLSDIIGKLFLISKEDYTTALEGWRMVFQEWDKLNDFLKSQLELTAINKRLPEIIAKLIKAQKPDEKGLGRYA